ncbi:MAG TPA: hypothetical protein VFE58_03775 [Tepidisphaeraceae bacterium]|jgi:hypothetical protein|nr:hypothetical protein [Tepidisphaeraceae bacterium]
MKHEETANSATLRQQRRAELELTLFRHGFEIIQNDTGAIYIGVTTSHASKTVEPLMLDYKRDVTNYIERGFSTPHDVAMHFVHRYAFRTQSWIAP